LVKTLNFEFVIKSESMATTKLIVEDRMVCSAHFGRCFDTQVMHMDIIRLCALAEQGLIATRGSADNDIMVRW
jgi:hypothetical protein